MKKIIDERYYCVIYQGKIEELKNQLGNLIEKGNPSWMDSMLYDINELEKINQSKDEKISDMYQNIYYSNKEILYGVNSSEEIVKKDIFPIIKKICKLADEEFITKYGKNSLEIVVSEK